MEKIKKRSKFIVLTLLVALIASFCTATILFLRIERVVSESAHQLVVKSSVQQGAQGSAQLYYRVFCSPVRHRYCRVALRDESRHLLAEVPTGGHDTSWFAQSITLPLSHFSPQLVVTLTYVPAGTYLAVWALVAFGFTGVILLFASFVSAQNSRRELTRYYQLQLQLHEAESSLGRLASQVAHDIRSPLAALNIAVSESGSLPEDLRVLVRTSVDRIRYIANNLLEQYPKSGSPGGIARGKPLTEVLVPDAVEAILTEKRIQHNTTIELKYSTPALFSRISRQELQRVVSNLVENSIESQLDGGKVEVRIEAIDNWIHIRIRDEGHGIPAQVLEHFGERGYTFGKKGGSGLGLFSAKNVVEKWGGNLAVETTGPAGTTVLISLRQAPAPVWMAASVPLSKYDCIVIVDDDAAIHELWDRKFKAVLNTTLQYSGKEIVHFIQADEAAKYLSRQSSKATLLLVDYEFSRQNTQGITLVEQLGMGADSILVTSHVEEVEIIETCTRIGLKILPKNLVSHAIIT